jgi:hypothetical protein
MKRSDYFRFRTGVSGLTDDELMILDHLFQGCWFGLKGLYEEDFAFHANLPFSHGFSDDEVRTLLSRWQQRGWLEYEEERHHMDCHWYKLTPRGGMVWEQERMPNWERFCSNTSWHPESGPSHPRRRYSQWLTIVTSPSRKIAEAYIQTGKRCHLFDGEIVSQSRTTRKVRNWSELSWKVFPRAFEIRTALRCSVVPQTDRERYGREMLWWRGPSELIELRLKGIE